MKTVAVKVEPDVVVVNEGSLFLFFLNSEPAKDWWKQNCQDGMTYGRAKVVEHRFAEDIANGMLAEGLVLQ